MGRMRDEVTTARLVVSSPMLERHLAAVRRGAGGCLVFAAAAIPGFREPDLTALGAAFPDAMRAFNVLVMLALPAVCVWLSLLVRSGSRRWAVIYGYSQRGRPYLGSRLGAFLPWRRIRCVDGMQVDLGSRPSRTDRNNDKWLLMTVRSGRRHVRIRSMRPTTESDARRLRTWLAGQDVEAAVVFGEEGPSAATR